MSWEYDSRRRTRVVGLISGLFVYRRNCRRNYYRIKRRLSAVQTVFHIYKMQQQTEVLRTSALHWSSLSRASVAASRAAAAPVFLSLLSGVFFASSAPAPFTTSDIQLPTVHPKSLQQTVKMRIQLTSDALQYY